jgi:hypothetical protein
MNTDDYDELDDRHQYADTDDDTRNNWRAWSGRSFVEDREHRDRNLGYGRDPLSRDSRAHVEPSYEERYGHPSLVESLDYDEQWASRSER